MPWYTSGAGLAAVTQRGAAQGNNANGGGAWVNALRPDDAAGTPTFIQNPTIPGDTTPPVTLFVSETLAKVSLVTGFTSTDVSWSADEDCQAWEIRDVTGAPGTTHSDGVLVASGGAISANVTQVTTVPSSALTAGDGSKTLKLFAQDLAGNWTP